ncbi:tripartite tricarboxylate transporter substrate binding protein [Bosea sp. BK604]|uniref:tripartite tricarboxylate transporter substrate binding protein n=1 Tax=Bosea sp. BK604 TaxID=2512180 RepID=UPI00104F7042|nr:tripartite tricarboxylate transporter substrate binding protein [Bosea sp. BK604]TCR61786.1 putative tricarboxylic transport membrane protein [Bosea sp. BK604]
MLIRREVLFAIAAALSLSATAHADDSWKPKGNIEFIVGAGPGGENDRIARAIQRALQDGGFVPSMTILNKPGAGQVIAITDLASRKGNTNTIGLASGSFINAIARSGSNLHTRVVPVMKLFDAYQAFFTKADSSIKTMADVKERLKADPKSVTFAFPVGLGSPLHVAAVQVAKTAGVKPAEVKTVVFDSGADVSAQISGGHVDVGITSIGSAMPLIQAGKARFLGLAAPERMGGDMKDVPTLREQGLDVIVANSYNVLLPGSLKPEQVAFWTKALDAVLENKQFQADLDRNFWVATPVRYPGSVAEFNKEYDENRTILKEIGFAE